MSEPPFSAEDFSPSLWSVVAKARKDSDRLKKLLVAMSRDEIVDFYNEFVAAAVELRCSPYLENMPESEDGVEDVTEWIVSQGKAYYAKIVTKPEDIPRQLPPHAPSFKGITLLAFWERFGESIPRRGNQ